MVNNNNHHLNTTLISQILDEFYSLLEKANGK